MEVFSTNCLRFAVPSLGDPRALSDQQSTRLLVSGHCSPVDFAEFKTVIPRGTSERIGERPAEGSDRMGENSSTFDLIVIGGGPAGIVGATTAAALGRKVALVESHAELGGAGANTGTVPSKTLRETALALSGMKSRNLYGVDLSLRREATVADFLRHEQHVKAGLNEFLSQRLKAWDTAVYRGQAVFDDPHSIRVSDGGIVGTLRGERILRSEEHTS